MRRPARRGVPRAGAMLLAIPAVLGLALLLSSALAAPRTDARHGSHEATPPGSGRVLLVHLEGPVSPVTDEALESAVDRGLQQIGRAHV